MCASSHCEQVWSPFLNPCFYSSQPHLNPTKPNVKEEESTHTEDSQTHENWGWVKKENLQHLHQKTASRVNKPSIQLACSTHHTLLLPQLLADVRRMLALSATSKGKKKTRGTRNIMVRLRAQGILSLESSVIMGHACTECRTQISKKADFISSVAQGTTCLLMQLLCMHLPFQPLWCRPPR